MDSEANLLSFGGRIGRLGYWGFSLAATLAMVLIVYAALYADPTIAALAIVGGGVPVVVGSFAVCIKRLHDRDKSAWWLLIFYGIPMLLQALPFVLPMPADARFVAQIASAVLQLWAFVELGFLRGTDGPNQYGT